ncbi:YggT family protein [Magnetovibrio sp. PR-2]|uniref:YggT family protein n=1 Tax=Magnetovibrio sp. PR-2 TaxID=3120356 RepID=UPI002FCE5BC2
MDILLVNVLKVINAALGIYWFVIIANVVMSWLIAFQVLNTSNRFVYAVVDITYRLTEPLYRRIRPILPDLGAIDIAPILVLLGIMLLQGLIGDTIMTLRM